MPAAGHYLTARDVPRPRRDRARCLQTGVGAKRLASTQISQSGVLMRATGRVPVRAGTS